MANEATKGTDNDQAVTISNEFNKRMNQTLDPAKRVPAADLLSAVQFVTMMGFSPATAAVNLSQNYLVTLPRLAAEFGPLDTTKEFHKQTGHYAKALAKSLASTETTRKGLSRSDFLQESELKKGLTRDEQKAFSWAVDNGVIGATQTELLTGASANKSDVNSSKLETTKG